MSSGENDFAENFATIIVRWVCFAGLLVVLAFGILFGSFAISQPQNSLDDASASRKNARFGRIDPKIQEIADLNEKAGLAFDNRNWEESARLYSLLAEKNPNDSRALYRIGWSLQNAGKLDEALEAYQAAKKFPYVRNKTLYNMAVIHARKKDKTQALSHLKQAIQAGYISPEIRLGDKEQFAFLKEDSEFQRLERLSLPLGQRTIYRQFDFILGSWQLYDKNDRQVGTKRIVRKENNGYLLTVVMLNGQRNRTMGFNFVDPEDLKWKQIWVQPEGTALKYVGEFRDGKMQFTGKAFDDKGNVVLRRKVYIPVDNNKVKHLIERSTDGGKTWTNGFDGYWLRVAEESTRKK